jgi:DNA-binding NtrC family response regulator
MFGHEKGAFTGAIKTVIGKFEQADKGTLFLDEITNLPYHMQSKLLRVIEERKITRVGGKSPIKVDIRIIAATNKDIGNEMHSNRFREDLFFRLSEFKISIPPLRERKEDIPFLANFFIKEFGEEFDKHINRIEKSALSMLMRYNWPGNVRELRNVLKRAVLVAKGNAITKDELIFDNKPNELSKNKLETFDDVSYQSLLNKVKIINDAIAKANGNKTKAANMLGITRNQLYRILNKAKKTGIDV